MIIQQTIRVGKVTGDYAFAGDPNTEWFCEIIDAEFGNEPNPVVNSVRQGWINLTCQPRHLNATFKVAFHSADDKAEVAKMETLATISEGVPTTLLQILAKVSVISKKVAFGFLTLFVLSTVFAAVNYYWDLTGFFEQYQKYNAANGAKVISKKVGEIHKSLTEDIWDSPGIKVIEEEQGVDFEDLFNKVENNLFMMGDPFRDAEKNAILMTHGEAEDKCEEYGSVLLTDAHLSIFLKRTIKFGIYAWSGTPEWTSDSKSMISDDYLIHIKGGDVPNNAYVKDGKVFGDAEDVEVAARCAFTRSTFME